MIDRLRELLDRPIAEAERRRLFALVAVAVLGAGLILALAGRPAGEQSTSPVTPGRPETPPAVSQPAPAPPAPQPQPSGETRPVTASARRFLTGYLAYLYGHGPARAIPQADPTLRRRLQRERPRVSPATRRRRGRVAELSVRRVRGGRFAVTATIDDGGVARYPVSLTLQRYRGDGWRVVEVGGE